MYPFDLINPLPPDMVISVQLGAARAFYFIVVLAAATLALMIAFDRLHNGGKCTRAHTPKKEADTPLRRAA